MKYINKLGQYEYPQRGDHYNIDIQTIIWDKSEELKYVYTGQLLPETDIFDGIWMIVYNNGSTAFFILLNFIKNIIKFSIIYYCYVLCLGKYYIISQ